MNPLKTFIKVVVVVVVVVGEGIINVRLVEGVWNIDGLLVVVVVEVRNVVLVVVRVVVLEVVLVVVVAVVAVVVSNLTESED